jgi:beta-aspartyl-peptidase (threonine type)
VEEDIRKLLDEQCQAWNRGDLNGFLDGYWNSPKLRMVAGKDLLTGWETIKERYAKRYPAGQMGQLSFGNLDIEPLGPDRAWAVGRWKVVSGAKTAAGYFTLLLRRFPEGWRIVHDHTSGE